MTHETKRKVKQEAFCEMRRSAVTCMTATIGTDVEDSWEGVMRAVSEVRRSNDPDKFAGVMLAAMKWMHARCEQMTYEKVDAAEALIASDAESAHAANGNGNGDKSAPAAK